MTHSVSFISAVLITSMVGGAAYLHKLDGSAKATLAESRRINLETQERLRQIQVSADALASERREIDALAAQRTQEIAERENWLRDQQIAAHESRQRQEAELRTVQQSLESERQRLQQSVIQATAEKRHYEENLSRWAVERARLEERRRQEDLHKAQQTARLAADQERALKSMQATTSHISLQKTAATISPNHAPTTVVVRYIQQQPTSRVSVPAKRHQHCKLQTGYRATVTHPVTVCF